MDDEPRGFIDWRCGQCGKRYGWAGTVKDAIPCPRCGDIPDPADIQEVEDTLARARQELLDKIDQKGSTS